MNDIISPSETNLVEDCKSKLLEHFDTVRIFVTRHSGERDNTATYDSGGGNIYAQLGQIHEWMAIQDQFQRQFAKHRNGVD